MLHRSTGNDHAVELLIAHLGKVAVEHHHMLYRRVLRGMTLQFHETDLQLQRCIGQQTDQVCLGRDLQRHQVQNHDAQGTDVLGVCPGIVHDEYILLLQEIDGRQSVW